MSNQHWLKIAGVSTLLAGTAAAITIPVPKPLAVLGASTAGAVGGILLSTPSRSQSTKPKATAQSYDGTGAKLIQLEQLVQKNHAELKAELHTRNGMRASSDGQGAIMPVDSSPYGQGDPLSRLERLLLDNHNELATLTNKIQQPDAQASGAKRTAILYDIENLIKGFNISQELLTSLSLKEVLTEIRKKEQIGHILVQQAFANWSDTRLRFLRVEINELGIDPIQVFGFAREQKKNAADIELVINAIDLAYVRSAIEVFVIVSGDGGFASLAKKLHEYGKIVIGCAYHNSASQTFRSVCDDFIWLPDPEEEERADQNNPATGKQGSEASQQRLSTLKKKNSTVPINPAPEISAAVTKTNLSKLNTQIINQLNQIKDQNQLQVELTEEQLVEATKNILKLYTIHPAILLELSSAGINISAVHNAVQYAIPNFRPSEIGFAKFTDYIQYVCQNSELCIARASQKVILALRHSVPMNATVLPDLDARMMRSEGLSPTNVRFLSQMNQIKQDQALSTSDPIAITKSILTLYATDPVTCAELRESGFHVSILQEVMKYLLPEFQPIQLGFAKFSEYMQYACKDSEFCIGRVPQSNLFLFFRDALPPHTIVLPDLEPRTVHSVETYRAVLASGTPSLKFPSPHELHAITTWIVDHPIVKTDLGSVIEDLVTGLNGEISSDVIKLTLFTFLAVELFIREPEGVPLSEQVLTLREDARSRKEIMQFLESAILEKLSSVLPTLDPEIIRQILPDVD